MRRIPGPYRVKFSDEYSNEEGTAAAREGQTREPAAPVLLVAIAFALITVDIRGGEASPVDGARRGRRLRVRTGARREWRPRWIRSATRSPPSGTRANGTTASAGLEQEIIKLKRENRYLEPRPLPPPRVLAGQEAQEPRAPEGTGSSPPRSSRSEPRRASPGPSPSTRAPRDGLKRDMTVLNGDGLMGRVTTDGPVHGDRAARQRPRLHRGHPDGGAAASWASRPARGGKHAERAAAQRQGRGQEGRPAGHLRLAETGKPFVAGVPVGEVNQGGTAGRRPDPDAPGSGRWSGSAKLDVVGVVVEPPRKDPRDKVLQTGSEEAEAPRPPSRHGHTVQSARPTAPTSNEQ